MISGNSFIFCSTPFNIFGYYMNTGLLATSNAVKVEQNMKVLLLFQIHKLL
jgi:hypothetical protein